MKILLITENLGSGGAERQFTGLAVFLKNKGYDIQVVTYLERQFYETYLKENGVKYRLHPELLNKYTRWFYLYRLVKKYKPEVIISFLSSVNMSMCLTKLFYRSNLIVSERSHTLQFGVKSFIRYNLYRFANSIVPNSESESENIKKHYPFLANKISVIQNFVDVDYFKPIPYRKKNETPLILSVGRLIPSKNVIRLIDAAKILLNKGCKFKIVWVGKQYDKEYLSEVKDRIKKHGLSEVFILKDQTNDILLEYQNADFFCLPTLFEGYPNVICEAMSCGLPVVCSRVCEIPNIVIDGVNGFLFDPYDVDDIANAIANVLNFDNHLYDKVSMANRFSILENNSIESFVDKYVNLF